jgi:hypothetical protein
MYFLGFATGSPSILKKDLSIPGSGWTDFIGF